MTATMTDPCTSAKFIAELDSKFRVDIEKPEQCLDIQMQGEHVIGFNQFYKLTTQVPPERCFLHSPHSFF